MNPGRYTEGDLVRLAGGLRCEIARERPGITAKLEAIYPPPNSLARERNSNVAPVNDRGIRICFSEADRF